MTTTRKRIETALDGGTPDKTPLGIYDFFIGGRNTQDPDGRRLIDAGLGVITHVGTVGAIEHGVELTNEEDRRGPNDVYWIQRRKTPVGELRYVTHNGWHHESWIKEPNDYKIWQWVIEHTELTPTYDSYHQVDAELGDKGIPIVSLHRTPAMVINIDIAGTERFCMDLAMEVPELFDLYAAMRKLHRQTAELVAKGPGKYVKWLENLTISMLGPRRYKELLVSVYDELMPALNAAGKRVMVHYDGEIACIKDAIAAAPFHIIESITEPPEGDMMYDQARAAWPDKGFWANINVGLYAGTPESLRQAVIDKRARAGKKALAFEVSEDMPRNWKESIPVVLKTLEELD